MDKMEVKIPREVRKYKESIMLGLTMRQFICSGVAVAIAVIAYFGLRDELGNEGVSWVCILVAAPIALVGFVTYHEMTFEHIVLAWVKSEFLMPKRLCFKSDNYICKAYVDFMMEKERQTKRQKQIEMIEHFKNRLKEIQEIVLKRFTLAKGYILKFLKGRDK